MEIIIGLVVLSLIIIFFARKQSDTNKIGSAKTGFDTAFPVGRVISPPFGEYEYDIVGEASYQQALGAIVGGKTENSVELKKLARIKRDLDNQYDKNAVVILIDNRTVGYLNKYDAKEFCNLIKRKGFHSSDSFDVEALIVGGWKRKDGEGKFGVKLNMPDDINDVVIQKY
ncbi:HIRAN domain-containing protein [Acinetobacter radioresistens]|uniref:HIRAN domain-containing protein n=1 Tax=Acinetobacter radioresistens TaxID=40216 RepID=UPI003212D743